MQLYPGDRMKMHCEVELDHLCLEHSHQHHDLTRTLLPPGYCNPLQTETKPLIQQMICGSWKYEIYSEFSDGVPQLILT